MYHAKEVSNELLTTNNNFGDVKFVTSEDVLN